MKVITILWLVLMLPMMASAQTPSPDVNLLKHGDLETSLRLLNLAGQRPDWQQQFYSDAYDYLAGEIDRTVAGMADQVAFQRVVREHGLTHLGGPMLGSIQPDSVKVWLRTCRPGSVEVRVMADGVERVFGPVEATAESDLTAVVAVTGLKPEGKYPYRVLVDGVPIAMPDHAAIVTATNDEHGAARIAFGTCYHRWGLTNSAQAAVIRKREPDALLLGGDIAVQDRDNHLGLHRADYLLRDQHAAWNDLVCRVPVFATWDDHDYFNNDKAGIPKGYSLEDKQGVHKVFCQSWNNPSWGFGDDRRGIFFRTRVGPCDVIMLDNRYFRSGEKGSFLGEAQMQWLERQLLDCRGPFIILSCGTMWSDYVSNGKDSWGRWDPEGRERVFRLIEEHHIGGVLLISGDRHGARGFRIPRPSGFEFYEFEAGSLGARTGPPTTKPEWKDVQLYGISGRYAFGEFSIDASPADPTVTFRLIGDDGATIYETLLTRSQLTPR